ncbi:MAG: IPT/TIG domain-containing protein [Balneolaceae bacterium]|jgi:uncharacterized protein (TIGR03437 family)
MYKGIILLVFLTSSLIGCGDKGTSTSPAPEITSISPTSGPTGTTVTIKGSGFAETASANKVTFNGVLANVTSASESAIEAAVPEEAASGAVQVVVDGRTAVGPNFTVEEQMPGITAVEPDSGEVGTKVTITGMNFSPTPSDNIVTFNGGVISEVQQASETELIMQVPDGAESGPIKVEVDGKKTFSPSFKVITSGTLEVSVSTSGSDLDPDGYTLKLDTGELRALSKNDTVTFKGLEAGEYEMELKDIADNCSSNGTNPRTVNISNGPKTSTSFSITCTEIGKIAYISTRTGDNEIWSIDADGANEMNLTRSTGMDDQYRWSPNGTQIAFRSDRSGNNEIWVMNADGSNPVSLTNNPSSDQKPRWSPDGSQILFESFRSGISDIWVMNADGTNQTNLTSEPGGEANAQWSPDGSKIVFDSDSSSSDLEIWIMDSDGSNKTQLTNAAGFDQLPQWSPDGTKIAFQRSANIWVMNADGSNQTQLTNMPGVTEAPKWSPDGSQIVFQHIEVTTYEIWVMDADGSNVMNITNEPAFQDRHPVWSPGGTRIAFESDRSGDLEVWTMNPDGSDLRQITHRPGDDDILPQWRPN